MPKSPATRNCSKNSGLPTGVNPFVASSIRIYPLTRVAMDEGEVVIVCHIEVKDQWGDPVKALGALQVQLFRPASGDAGSEQVLRWEVPLDDERFNAASYDPATRTYRVRLGDLPPWVASMAERAPDDSSRERIELRASFRTRGKRGEELVLTDGTVLER